MFPGICDQFLRLWLTGILANKHLLAHAVHALLAECVFSIELARPGAPEVRVRNELLSLKQ